MNKQNEAILDRYNEDLEYVEARIPGSSEREKHLQEVDFWKIKYLKKVAPPDHLISSILEIGCAMGDLIGRFPSGVPLSKRYGIDISSKNITFAREQYPGIHFSCGTFEEYIKDHPEFRVDLIILSDILEHVDNDLFILEKSGQIADYVLLNLPLEKCDEFRDREFGPDDFRGHLRAYDLNDARRLVEEAGLVEIKQKKKTYVKSRIFRRHLRTNLKGDPHMKDQLKFLIKYALARLYDLRKEKPVTYCKYFI